MAIQYHDLSCFLGNLFTEFKIDHVLIEDMSTYDVPMVQQYYFMVGESMVAHWSPSGKFGAIIGLKQNSQWSTRYRKFEKLTLPEFEKLLKVK